MIFLTDKNESSNPIFMSECILLTICIEDKSTTRKNIIGIWENNNASKIKNKKNYCKEVTSVARNDMLKSKKWANNVISNYLVDAITVFDALQ